MSILDEQRELSRREKKRKKKREKLLIKFAIILVGILILAVFLSYVISDEVHMAESLIDKYNSLGQGLVTDSKEQFSKKLMFITVYTDENGELKLAIGDNSMQTEGTGNEDSDNDDDNDDEGPTIGDDISVDGWYTDLGNQPKGSVAETLEVCQGHSVNVYKGFPWAINNDAFFFNLDLAQSEVIPKFEEAGVKFGKSTLIVNSDESSVPSSKGHSIDGENVWGIGVYANMLERGYVPNKIFSSTAAEEDSSGKQFTYKMALVMVKKGNEKTDINNWYTIPVSKIDAKVHTFPYAVLQTNVKVEKERVAQISTNWSGTGGHCVDVPIPSSYDTVQSIKYLNEYITHKTTISGLKRNFDGKDATSFPNEVNFSMGSWGGHKVETYHTLPAFRNYITSEYDIVGTIKYN